MNSTMAMTPSAAVMRTVRVRPRRLTTGPAKIRVSASPAGRRLVPDGRGDDGPRFFLNGGEVLRAAEGLGVELVDVLGAGRAGGEPAGPGDHLQPADRRVVARRGGQRGQDLLAGQLAGRHLLG